MKYYGVFMLARRPTRAEKTTQTETIEKTTWIEKTDAECAEIRTAAAASDSEDQGDEDLQGRAWDARQPDDADYDGPVGDGPTRSPGREGSRVPKGREGGRTNANE
ncbi:unnamed protein product [Phytophthora fragariaefolia]|uniref:Unnamed protein product n=1 Tax=Phytophthora fragariaefolia TaxID=1490495 RepID=A0A9W7CV68_9STRA|nr:unnamed protein product [Phytophthora fragariaefolia]